MSTGDAAVYSFLGIATVFFALVLLMLMIKVLTSFTSKKEADAQPDRTNAEQAEVSDVAYAPGSAGEVKLYDTDPRDAALIMAIVADKLGKPVNELRFISIREVKNEI